MFEREDFFFFLFQHSLCQYHSTHVLRLPGSNLEQGLQLSSLALSFLHDVITLHDPTLGHAFITSLTVSVTTSSSQQYLSNNESLQFVYLDCIDECLDVLKSLEGGKIPENDSDSQYESDQALSPQSGTSGPRLTGTQHEKVMSMVYSLLSLIDGGPEMTRLTKKIDTLFHTLLQTSYTVSAGLDIKFDVGRIYGCLLGRQSTFLLSRLQEVEEFLWLNTSSEQTVTSLTSPAGWRGTAQLSGIEEMNREGGGATGLGATPTCSEATRVEWRNRFYSALLDHRHFLEATLDRGLQLIYTGKLQDLGQLLSKPEFVPLRPVLLLLGWDRYAASGSGKELLDALWPMEVGVWCACLCMCHANTLTYISTHMH